MSKRGELLMRSNNFIEVEAASRESLKARAGTRVAVSPPGTLYALENPPANSVPPRALPIRHGEQLNDCPVIVSGGMHQPVDDPDFERAWPKNWVTDLVH
jgi:hypothetical protein